MPVQNPQVFIVMLADAEGDFDPLLRLRGDGKEPQKLLTLASVMLPLKGGLLRTPPIRDGRKALGESESEPARTRWSPAGRMGVAEWLW